MAKVNDIFGTGISGRLGQVVFYQHKGKNCMRSLPASKNKTSSPLQLQNRRRFLKMMQFSQQFKFVVIPQIWNTASKTLSGQQLFMKTNKGAFDKEGNLTDPTRILISVGKLTLPFAMIVKRQEANPGSIVVRWAQDSSGGKMTAWDELMVIAYGQGQYSDIQSTSIRRGDSGGTFELPPLSVPITHLYLFFSSLDRRNYSESVCFGLDSANG